MKKYFLIYIVIGFIGFIGFGVLSGKSKVQYSTNPELGITTVPSSMGSAYTSNFDRYTKVTASNGKAIHIVAQSNISNEQLVRARKVLEHFLTNYAGSQFGANKAAVANKMGDNGAILLLLNGSDNGSNDPTVDGQALYQDELVVEGSRAYINNDYDNHRDATFEEILHMVHDYGIGVDGANSFPGALAEYQSEIRAAQVYALANSLWGMGDPGWIQELTNENSLTQEYLAAVIDSYYGYWGAWTGGSLGMWGLYIAKTRSDIQTKDTRGWALVPKFFHPYLTYNARIDSSFSGTFYMNYSGSRPYTHKSQYLKDITLTGSNDTKVRGNGYNNSITGNSGSNTVIFSGAYSQYTVTTSGSVTTVKDNTTNRDGTDRLTAVEFLQFSDQTVAVGSGGGGNETPTISLDKSQLNFTGTTNGAVSAAQTFTVNNSGSGTLSWTLSENGSWLNCSPASGGNSETVTVTASAVSTAGTYTAMITITDNNASNVSQSITVQLMVSNIGSGADPFGQFATPVDGSQVAGSIAVTGWALDDAGVESVKIYRDSGSGMVYIGDASFVEGSRPDVEAAYPGYPNNSRAGWGYMVLTNFLPGGGNGTFTLYAISRDVEGNDVTLGAKTIRVDNNNAVKPFGAIDTPTQGGTASGSSFINWGWALTPQPGEIPTDGSTIKVFVDGALQGSPVYDIYRSDIAGLFPGYANSNGAIGYFFLDTTAFSNGVHTIQWVATDDLGRSDGIGSRYFSVSNPRQGVSNDMNRVEAFHHTRLQKIPLHKTHKLRVMRGFGAEEQLYHSGAAIHMDAMEPISIRLPEGSRFLRGFLKVGAQLRPLPVGSFIDTDTGTFHWGPGLAFTGPYQFVFMARSGDQVFRIPIMIHIK